MNIMDIKYRAFLLFLGVMVDWMVRHGKLKYVETEEMETVTGDPRVEGDL